MQENGDYVTMDTYSADMAENTKMAVSAIGYWRQRAEQAERMLAECVLAAGGRVRIVENNLHDPRRKVQLTNWINPSDRAIELEAVVASQ